MMEWKRRNIWLILVWGVFLCVSSINAQDNDWKIKKSKHFIVYYKEGSGSYLNQVVTNAEKYYKSITDYLGLRRLDFWTWKKRCRIYLYTNKGQYLSNVDTNYWAKGRVHVIKKEIVTYAKEEEFLEYTLPHELGHIIFRETIGFDKKLPLWLDEGVAVLQEKDRSKYLNTAKKIIGTKNFVPLYELSKVRDYEKVPPVVLYSEAASLVSFLLEEYGRRRFVKFCRRIRDKDDWEKALLKVYKFEDLKDLEKMWIGSLKDKEE